MTTPLAPALGRLASPPGDSPWEPIRLDMVDALVDAHSRGALDGAAWLAAWTAAAERVRDLVIGEATVRLQRAAVRSRMPASRLEGLLPDPVEGDRLLQRLLAEGVALEELEAGPDDPERRRRRGAALEVAWDGAVQVATVESSRYRHLAERAAAWRRSWLPLATVGAVLATVATLAAAMIAGVFPAPAWFRPVVDAFWSLPWP